MSQRSFAATMAAVLLVLLGGAALVLPLPYVTYEPGLTVDVLGEDAGEEIIEIDGRRAYRDEGQLRMTTVYVTRPGGHVSLWDAMHAWLSDEEAIYPYESVYPPGQTAEESETESAVEMVSSQDAAAAVALRELGYDVTEVVEILDVADKLPADGKLEVRDVLVEVGGIDIDDPQDVVDAVDRAGVGEPLEFVVARDGKRRSVEVTPRAVDGDKRVGISPGLGFEFPFKVKVKVSDQIGGPSAGLMFSLAIYDTLTAGSLTGDRVVAGTGTITKEGKVGPIGGIQQKIVAARDAGAELFLVPSSNCDEALGAPRQDVRLVRADTMRSALDAIKAWTSDRDAELPSCEKGGS
jgi:Lon-like protease